MNWQTWISLFCVLVAAGFLFRRAIATVRSGLRGGAVRGCGNCSKQRVGTNSVSLVQLDRALDKSGDGDERHSD